jgi:hypothetical protein
MILLFDFSVLPSGYLLKCFRADACQGPNSALEALKDQEMGSSVLKDYFKRLSADHWGILDVLLEKASAIDLPRLAVSDHDDAIFCAFARSFRNCADVMTSSSCLGRQTLRRLLRLNPYSSKQYRSIQFTVRQLVRLKNPLYAVLEQLQPRTAQTWHFSLQQVRSEVTSATCLAQIQLFYLLDVLKASGLRTVGPEHGQCHRLEKRGNL